VEIHIKKLYSMLSFYDSNEEKLNLDECVRSG